MFYDQSKDTGVKTVNCRKGCDLMCTCHLERPDEFVTVIWQISENKNGINITNCGNNPTPLSKNVKILVFKSCDLSAISWLETWPN